MPTPEAALQQQLLTSQAELAVVKAKLKAAHQALRVLQTSGPDSELNHLLDGSGIAIIFMNTELHILRFTPAAALFVNLLPTDRGRNGAHLAAQFAGYDHLLDDARRVMATQKRHELLVQTQVGLWFEMRIWPYRRPDQVTMGVVITLIDIADRRRAAPADAPGAAQYQAMVAWSPEAINIVQDGRFVYLNPVAVQLYGARSADELLGQLSRDWVHPDDVPLAVQRMHNLTNHDASAPRIEMKFLKVDGSTLLVQAQAKSIDYEGASAVHVAWRDITAEKHMQQVLAAGQARLEMAEEVLHLAFNDALTSLPNRRMLQDRLYQAMHSSRRNNCHGALIFLDLDNFKSLNDNFGHEAGDLLLMEVATRLKSCIREVDTVARFGGDEFVVILIPLSADQAEATMQATLVTEKIRNVLALPYRLMIQLTGQAAYVLEHQGSASIGVALFAGQDSSHHDIMKRADVAMYQAKAAGRNRVQLSLDEPVPDENMP